MNSGNNLMMGDKEYEMVSLLRQLSLSKPVAKTLACMSAQKTLTSRDIEEMSRLRQPEVSIAMNYLKENEWVAFDEVKKEQGKGRPIKVYWLTVPMERILHNIEEEIRSENKKVLQSIERLKGIL